MKNYLDYTVNILEELLNIPSPSGDTSKIIEIVKHHFADLGLKTKINAKNGLVVEVKGEIEDKVKVTIKLNAGFRKSSGNYNVSIHELNNPDALAGVGAMPANVPTWQSGNILSASGSTFKYHDLYDGTTRYVKILDGADEVAVGRWNVVP